MALYIGNKKVGKVIVGTQSTSGGINTDDATLTSGAQLLATYTAYAKGKKYTGTIPTRTENNLSASGDTVTVPAGYYDEAVTKSVDTADLSSPSITVDAAGLVTATVNQPAGYVEMSSSNNTKQLPTQGAKMVLPGDTPQTAVTAGLFTTGNVTVSAVPTEEKTITTNGTYEPTSGSYFSSVVVNVESSGGEFTTQSKSISPSESQQTVTPDSGYDALSSVTVGAVSSAYVGSSIAKDPSITVDGASVSVPSGYYSSERVASVKEADLAEASIAVSSTGLITASAEQDAGYVSGGTISATKQLTTQAAKEITPSASAQTAVAKNVYTTGEITVEAVPTETTTLEANGTYVPTSGKFFSSVTVDVPGASLQSKSVSPTESEQTVTPDSSYDGLSSVTVGAISSTYIGSDISRRTSANLSASEATVTVPAGYYAQEASKSVSTTTQATPSISVSSTGLITASCAQTAGYVSGGTTSDTEQLTIQTAKTVTPTKSSQNVIAAGVYTTGAITVAAIPDNYVDTSAATADSSDIISGETAYVNGSLVTGTLVVQNYYTGSTDPVSTLGSDGDLYLKVVS